VTNVILLGGALLLAAPAGALLEPSTFPAEQQARWPLVVQKCGRCHSLEVALVQPYTPTQWYAAVRKMKRLPGAGIDEAQAAELFEFLKFYSGRTAAR